MNQPTLKIDNRLHALLMEEDCDRFRMMTLKDRYIARYAPDADEEQCKATRKWLYGQVQRLCKAGLLSHVAGSNRRQARYQRTAVFHRVAFALTGPDSVSDTRSAPAHLVQDAVTAANLLDELRELERQYQVDLLTSISESEEYKRLYATYPSLKAQLEPQYHEARERSSKLLGQLKAVESVIARQRA